MALTTQLRGKIDELIAADESRQSLLPKGGVSYFSTEGFDVNILRESHSQSRRVVDLVNELTDEELIIVTALTMYGTEQGSFDEVRLFRAPLSIPWNILAQVVATGPLPICSRNRSRNICPQG